MTRRNRDIPIGTRMVIKMSVSEQRAQRQELISIRQAASNGIDRLRKPGWATPEDHIKIDIIAGLPCPWIHLYCPFNTECNGRDTVDSLCLQCDLDLPEWLAYHGPLPDSDEYRAMVLTYDGCLGKEIS